MRRASCGRSKEAKRAGRLKRRGQAAPRKEETFVPLVTERARPRRQNRASLP